MERQIKIKQIAAYLETQNFSYTIEGDPEAVLSGFSSLTRYQKGTLTWINSSLKAAVIPSCISACVIQEGVDADAAVKIITPHAKAVFFSILEHFWNDTLNDGMPAIGPGTIIGAAVHIDSDVRIGCNCSIVGDISIGAGTVIGDNVVIRNKVKIGCYCTIQSLTVIGESGYGYFEDDLHTKTMIKHFGGVIIEDHVFIGNHTNIARGTIDDTIIKRGTKIAPSTLIAHNNYIGENASIVCAKLFGSVTVGDNAYVSSSIIRNQVKIGQNAVVGMGAVVTKDVADNMVVIGSPARVLRENSGKEKL